MKGKKTGGRTPKNSEKRKITFVPSNEALKIYNGWEKKAETLDRAIVNYQNKTDKE
jgi:hypothetical protein